MINVIVRCLLLNWAGFAGASTSRTTKFGRSCSFVVLFGCILAGSFPAGAADRLIADDPEAAISRLSDRDVRDLLIKQISSQRKSEQAQRESFNPAVFMYRLQRDAGNLSKQFSKIFSAFAELPGVAPQIWRNFTADREEGSLAWVFRVMLLSMALGAIGGFFLKRRLRPVVMAMDDQASGSTWYKATRLGAALLVDLACIAAFAVIAAGVFVIFFDVGQRDRIAFFFYLAAGIIFATAIAFSTAFYAPDRPALRLPRFTDADARSLHRAGLFTVGFGAFGFFTCAQSGTLGVAGEVHELFLILVGLITTLLLVFTIISHRRAIAGDIAAESADKSARRMLAGLWPWIFSAMIVLLWASLVVIELLRDFVPYGAVLFTIGVMAVMPSIDALLFREELKHKQAGDEVKQAMARGARFAAAVLVVVGMAIAWRVNPIVVGAEGSLGAKLANGTLQILLTLLVAYVVWQLVRIVIDRKIAEEDALLAAQGIDVTETEIGGTGLSRTRTLLPLFKRTVQVFLLVIVIMISLSALGVNITPLLAGAGVLGLAIGFGSQTLVRDIVSGAFFLIDDAFRIGEYIDVGSVKGVVEKISVRSLRMRHHRGAVHTVPFGEVKTLTNYSRDWAIMKLKFRVPFDTNVDKVRKLLKKVGAELAENKDIKDDFIQPFKSQGATEADDYGFVISTKFMSKPGKQFMIRRYAFAAVQKAFEENGIEFAMPKIGVTFQDAEEEHETTSVATVVQKPDSGDRRRSAAAGGAGLAAQNKVPTA